MFWLGLLFGWCARERVRADGPWSQPAITLVLLFLGIILVPAALYFYLAHASWSWLYLVDPAKMPKIVVVTVLVGQAAALTGGYFVAGRLTRAGKEVAVRGALGGLAFLLVILVLALRSRLMHYGSYAQFKAGRALPIMAVKLGYVLIAVMIGAGAAAATVAWELLRDGRRAVTK